MKITLYKITKCGFYGSRGRSFVDGALYDWYTDFIEWTKTGKNIEDTAFLAPEESNVVQSYCVAASRLLNGFGIILWNEIPNDKGEVSFIDGRASVGNPKATSARAGAGQIPGWPAYFWILPDKNLIYCLRTDAQSHTNSIGLPLLRSYLKSYLLGRSRYFVIETGEKVLPSGVNAYFLTRMVKNKKALEKIRKSSEQIQKLHVHLSAIMDNNSISGTKWYHALAGLLDFPLSVPKEKKIMAKVEMPWTPSLAELDKVVEKWQDDDSPIGRMGVTLDSDKKIYWFDSIVPSKEYELSDDLELSRCWNAEQMQQAVQSAQFVIEELINEVQNE